MKCDFDWRCESRFCNRLTWWREGNYKTWEPGMVCRSKGKPGEVCEKDVQCLVGYCERTKAQEDAGQPGKCGEKNPYLFHQLYKVQIWNPDTHLDSRG